MKTAFILSFILLLLSLKANAQQTIDKLNANQLKLPKESANKALYLDGAGQVKSSSTISDTELGYLEGLSDTLVNLLTGKANDSDVVKLTGNQSVDGVKTFTGKLVASSTVNGSIPCPVMTEAERDIFTPVEGDCVYNSDSLKLNVFDGSVWKDVGGAGGISLWLTANPYNVNDITIESDKIYRCLIAHTSGTFATDLAASKWGEVSQGLTSPVALADGGTGLSITAVAGSIVYVDADSFEQLAPGTSGQVLQSNGSSAPSWVNKSISAKAENGSSVTAEEIQVPNNLLTQVDTNKHLNETGNNNILSNPSFEHSTFSTSWTNSVGTFTEESVLEIHGKKAAKLVLSSQTMSLTQSSSLYAAQFADGVQGLASVRVKSDVALKVCSVQAGVVSTSLCVDVQANNKWGLYKVPFILGATSNGISIASTGAVTGTVYIDDAFVGAASLTQNMNACQSVNCETTFSAKISGAAVVSDENLDWISTASGSGVYTVNFQPGTFTLTPNCFFTPNFNTGTNGNATIYNASSTSLTYEIVDNNNNVAQPAFLTCQKQGADFTAAKQLSNGNTYSSTNADTDWASCGHTTSSFTGFGSPTAIETQCKRQGGDLLMKGKFTAGIVTAVEARLSLPLWNGLQLVSAGTSIIPSLQVSGSLVSSFFSASYFSQLALIEPSVSYMVMGLQTNAQSAITKATGTNISATSGLVSFNARIPIEGWQQSNIIIGQFNGLESCTDTYQCTDTFSARVTSTGVVSDENIDWINGNCTMSGGSANTATCTLKTGLNGSGVNLASAMNCNWTSRSGGASRFDGATSTTTAIAATGWTVAGTSSPIDGFIICQKSGVDYIGKTAKAVASDQNVRSIGSTGMDIQSVFAGSGANCATVCTTGNCTICNQTGSKITSVSFVSTGVYNVNGIDGTKYNCNINAHNPGTSYLAPFHERSASTSTFARIQTGSAGVAQNAASMSVTCIGIP